MVMIDAVVHGLLLTSTQSAHARAVSDKAVVRALGKPRRPQEEQ